MNKRQFLKGMAAGAAGILLPSYVLSGQFEFHQRVSGIQAPLPLSRVNTGKQSNGDLLDEDGGIGWFGEVSASDLISGDELASRIGLSAGISQFSDAGWLHVSIDGTEQFVAKKPFRYRVSKHSIGSAISGNNQVEINGQLYRLRTLNGRRPGTWSVNHSLPWGGFDIDLLKDSEWNRVLYRLTDDSFENPSSSKENQKPFRNLALYTEEDLHLHDKYGPGTSVICHDRISYHGMSAEILRGRHGVSYFQRIQQTDEVRDAYGWRPVLQKL